MVMKVLASLAPSFFRAFSGTLALSLVPCHGRTVLQFVFCSRTNSFIETMKLWRCSLCAGYMIRLDSVEVSVVVYYCLASFSHISFSPVPHPGHHKDIMNGVKLAIAWIPISRKNLMPSPGSRAKRARLTKATVARGIACKQLLLLWVVATTPSPAWSIQLFLRSTCADAHN